MTIGSFAALLIGAICSSAGAQTIEELYEKALQEKTINFYGTQRGEDSAGFRSASGTEMCSQ